MKTCLLLFILTIHNSAFSGGEMPNGTQSGKISHTSLEYKYDFDSKNPEIIYYRNFSLTISHLFQHSSITSLSVNQTIAMLSADASSACKLLGQEPNLSGEVVYISGEEVLKCFPIK